MVAMAAKDYTIYYVAVALRNGQYVTFIEAETSVHEAMTNVKAELFQSSWDLIYITDADFKTVRMEGDTRLMEKCRQELVKEYPALAGKATAASDPPWKDKPLIPFARVWHPTPIIKFSESLQFK